jgi:putative lumazine-binding protein
MSGSASATSAGTIGSRISEYDAIVTVMNRYNEGVRTGSSAAMKPAFHEGCTFYGHYNGTLLAGPIQMLFDWVDANGPASDIRFRVTNVDVRNTIASVSAEVENMTGKLAGASGATLSDLFQLIKVNGNWLISQKSFHWHEKE